MKIYEIGTGYTPIPAQVGAATEIVVEELTKAFLKQGHEVEIIDVSASERSAHQLPIREVKVPSIFTRSDVRLGIMHKMKRVAYSVALAGELRKILKSNHERVILHFHNQYNLFFFLKLVPAHLRKKAHIAYTVHSYIWHGDWKSIEETVKRRYFQECYCMQNANSVFVLNEQTKKNIVENANVNADRVRLIDNGVNVDIYHPLTAHDKKKIKQKNSMEDSRVFVQVGSVCDRKNQLQAIKLLLPLMKTDPQIVYCYAGGVIDQDYQNAINSFVQEHGIAGQVKFFGEIAPGSKLNEFYNLGDAMIFPSKAEGFSLVIIESMAAGVPVVISQELQFMLSEECMKYESSEQFIGLLEKCILDSDELQHASQRVRRVIEDKYGWVKIAKDYYAVWSVIENAN